MKTHDPCGRLFGRIQDPKVDELDVKVFTANTKHRIDVMPSEYLTEDGRPMTGYTFTSGKRSFFSWFFDTN